MVKKSGKLMKLFMDDPVSGNVRAPSVALLSYLPHFSATIWIPVFGLSSAKISGRSKVEIS